MTRRSIKTILIGLCVLLLCCSIQQALANQIPDASSYRKRMIDTVVPPYRTAYRTLDDQIIQKLAKADTNSDQESIRALVHSLICASRTVHDNLGLATKASEKIRNDLDNHITALELSIVNQENQVQQSQQSVNEANANIQHSQQQVSLAETEVQGTQHALNTAEHEMREAQKKVDRARVCGRRRRRKRFLGKIGKVWRKHVEKPFVQTIRHTVIKPVCSIANSGGIDRAKQSRTLVEQRLHDAQQRLNNHQQSLAHQRAQYQTRQTQLNEASAQLHTLKSELRQQQTIRSTVTSLAKQFKDIETHLNTVLGSSEILQDEITRLIDFELVIAPLNAIWQEMVINDMIYDWNIIGSSGKETAAMISANLKILSEKLPKMPFNEMAEGTNIACVKLS